MGGRGRNDRQKGGDQKEWKGGDLKGEWEDEGRGSRDKYRKGGILFGVQ